MRQNYPNKLQAIQAVADLEEEAAGQTDVRRALRTSLSSAELADAEAAAEQANGLKLSQIVSHYLNLQARARAKGLTLDEGMAFLEARYRAETKEITILNAKDEFLASRIKISKSTLRNYEGSLRLLLRPDPNKFVHSFSVSDIEKATSSYENLSSLKTHRRIFSVFFHWAERHHYCLEDPCRRLDKLPQDLSQISILSLAEVRKLLSSAIQYQDGVSAAVVAIGLFAGLRPSEIEDLKPEDVTTDRIRVSGGKLRRKLKRTVPVSPVLSAWLEKYPFSGLPQGWDYKMKVLKKGTGAKNWVQDIIRHTSISFQTERDKNEALTAYNCGTSIQMMNRHYRDSVDDEKLVKEFWNLTPEKIRKAKLKVKLPTSQRVDWPPKAKLKKLVWQKPLVHAAKDLGVSDVALKKHCVRLGIELPPRGYWLKNQP
ncbi:tyrosine-type recombinase/integrase [Haloferula sp.]|uniref:tyrosine-type recombinase/integrase n=1 Tax=Haloferula sp. TaxID=2497595 RepID=UPI003C72D151